jgi:hypothetical protein
MGVRELKTVLAPENPFLIGKYPDRPAPAHVLNGFVAAWGGFSQKGGDVCRLIASNDPPPEFVFLRGAEWARDPRKLAALRRDLSVVLSPDRRVWKDKGSPAIVHARLATSDPSDDGLGPLLWEVVRRHGPPECEEQLSAVFLPADAQDPVTGCALILIEGVGGPRTRRIEIRESAWFGSSGTPAGKILARRLTECLLQLTRPRQDAQRLLQIQHFGRGLYFAGVLATLMGPLAAERKGQVNTMDEIHPLVVWCDTPPGPSDHPMVMAATRSFQRIVDQNRAALVKSLAEALGQQPLPRHLPRSQRRTVALQARLIEAGIPKERVDGVIEGLCEDAGVEAKGENPADRGWCDRVVESEYSAERLTRGFRTMGRKIGFIGPDRGAGAPRFLCETPLLGTLVAGLCPAGGTEFAAFVDLARQRLGLVFGCGTQDDLVERLGLWEGAGVGRRLLRENQEALRQRLIRAGLAREYSDGHTEVLNGA